MTMTTEAIAALALHLALAGAGDPAERLTVGTEWRCASPFADGAELEFKIMGSDRGGTQTIMLVTRTSAEMAVPVRGYGADRADKNGFFDPEKDRRDSSYLYAEYTQGFFNKGISMHTMWSARDPKVELHMTTFDYEHRDNPAKADRRSFSFLCQKISG